MIRIGAFAAKTHLASLIDRASRGEEVVITRHGRPVARLTSASDAAIGDGQAVAARLRALRSGTTLGSDWRTLRDEGRR